jgi:hypothetical protein
MNNKQTPNHNRAEPALGKETKNPSNGELAIKNYLKTNDTNLVALEEFKDFASFEEVEATKMLSGYFVKYDIISEIINRKQKNSNLYMENLTNSYSLTSPLREEISQANQQNRHQAKLLFAERLLEIKQEVLDEKNRQS